MSQSAQHRISLRVERALSERIAELARAADRSVSGEVRQALREHVAVSQDPGVVSVPPLVRRPADERRGSQPGPAAPALDGEAA